PGHNQCLSPLTAGSTCWWCGRPRRQLTLSDFGPRISFGFRASGFGCHPFHSTENIEEAKGGTRMAPSQKTVVSVLTGAGWLFCPCRPPQHCEFPRRDRL